jgi:membrane associated rhomboid family serine protease
VLLLLLFLLFPYANDNQCRRFPVATLLLIILNILVFAWQVFLHWEGHQAVIESAAYLPGRSAGYTLITNAFLHGSILHLGINMWFFLLVGGQVEERMGSFWFFLFYMGGAITSSLGHGLLCHLVGQPAWLIGASGAVFAVMGAYLILYPWEDFRFWYFILLRWGTIKIATFFFMAYKILVEVILAISQITDFGGTTVAHWAHLGGLAFGIAVALAAFGSYPFTGIRRLTPEEKAREKRLRRVARRRVYSDMPLPEPMSEEELRRATDDISPEEGIRRGLFFHSGRLLEWAYQEMLFHSPQACLEPDVQLKLIEQLRVHGRDALAEIAAWNLIDTYPESRESHRARFELGCVMASRREDHEEARRLLREFLDSMPPMRDQVEAERLLRRLQDRPLWQWKSR